MKISPLPNKWLIVLFSLSFQGSLYWSLWKWNDWKHKGMDGRAWPRGPPRESGHVNSSHGTDGGPQHLPHYVCPLHLCRFLSKVSDRGAWSRYNFLLKYSEAAASHAFAGHSLSDQHYEGIKYMPPDAQGCVGASSLSICVAAKVIYWLNIIAVMNVFSIRIYNI